MGTIKKWNEFNTSDVKSFKKNEKFAGVGNVPVRPNTAEVAKQVGYAEYSDVEEAITDGDFVTAKELMKKIYKEKGNQIIKDEKFIELGRELIALKNAELEPAQIQEKVKVKKETEETDLTDLEKAIEDGNGKKALSISRELVKGNPAITKNKKYMGLAKKAYGLLKK